VKDHILHLKHIKIDSIVLSIIIEAKINRQSFYGLSDVAHQSSHIHGRPHCNYCKKKKFCEGEKLMSWIQRTRITTKHV
jgi:hypothetical protein